MTFQRIARPRIRDAIVDQLEELILDGVLQPNERLPSERDLADLLDVSRPSLRAALAQLEARDLIVSHHGGGTYVADLLGDAFSAPLIHLFRTHPACALDYLEFRAGLEGQAAWLAARRATESDRKILHRIWTGMERAHAKDDPGEEAALDHELHHAVAEAAHNIVLLHVIRSLFALMRENVFYNRHQLYRQPGMRALLLEQHRALYEAVTNRRPDAAREAARNHLMSVRRTLKDFGETERREDLSRRRLERIEGGPAFR